MKKTATILLVFWLTIPTLYAQVVETILESPLIADYLALDPATGDIYSTNYEQISRISPDGTVEVVADADVFITGLGISAAGDLYYSDSGLFTANPVGSIYKRDTEGNITEFASGLEDIVGIWMSANNDGLFTQSYAGTVYFVNFEGEVNIIATGLANRMTDIVRDEAGNFYLAYFDFGRIDKMTITGSVTEFATIPSWLSYITYNNGYIYATGWQSHQVYRIEIATGEILVVAGSGDAGLMDGGATTAQFNIPNGILASVTGDTLYVSDNATNALRRIVGATLVSLEEAEQPNIFNLGQSYPNPFNPVTTIPYTILESSEVTLKIIDLLGREIETLVSQTQLPGSYTVEWEPGDHPSGVYLYRLEAEGHMQTRQMTLLK